MNKKVLRFLAVLLIFSICTSLLPASVLAVPAEESMGEKTPTMVDFIAGTATAEDIYGVLDPSIVPAAIDYNEAVEKNHIARCYEDEGTDLNKIIFLNIDGTKTMYTFDFPVKYVDDNGNIQDIRLEIADSTVNAGEFETAANDTATTFSAQFTDGIALEGNDTEIRLIPILPPADLSATLSTTDIAATTATAQRIDANTVAYLYDAKTTVEYSLTYTGFKEDIVVSEYTGQTEYPFRLLTNGLALEEIGGSFFLVDDQGNIEASIGDIIIFTADERNNAFGDIEPKTIVENQEYLLNIVVDAEYLADPATTYPIRIDPTIEIKYSNNGAGAVEDITISTNTNFSGSYTSLYVGRRSTEGIARILMRFPALDVSNLAGATVTSATVRIRDLMCEDDPLDVSCHVFTGSVWDGSSATWANSSPNSYVSTPLSTNTLSWSIGDTFSSKHWYTFDVTSAVQGWIDGNYAQSKGIIFKVNSSVENGSTIKNRTFGSYNRSSYRPSLSITYVGGSGGGDDFDSAVSTTLGIGNYVNIAMQSEKRYFKFTPYSTGTYVLMSGTYIEGDPKVWIYDSAYTELAVGDDTTGTLNFRRAITLTGGETYYIATGHFGNNTGSYYFTVLKQAEITNGFYQLRNISSNFFLDIHGPDEQVFVHQWEEHAGEQEKWLVQKQLDGHYTIRSQYGDHKYIGISTTSTGETNIQLYDDISDNTRWNLYIANNRYVFEPITAYCRALYAPDSLMGTEMQLSWAASGGNQARWFMHWYSYEGPTFSAFDVGDSSEDEVAIVKEWMKKFGYTDIGTYDNTEKVVLAETIKDIGRYSDIVYINGHGGRYANMKIQFGPKSDLDGDGDLDVDSNVISYLCADDSVNPGNDVLRVGIGADWLSGSTTQTESYWNHRTKWGILAQCAQLDYSTNAPNAQQHWKDTYYSAQVWARTMLGDFERIHGYVGYYNVAPGGDVHTERLANFFSIAEEYDRSIAYAWAQAHSFLIGSSDWAVLYHEDNFDDTFQTMTSSTVSGSPYTIYYVARDKGTKLLPLSITTGLAETENAATLLLDSDSAAFPVFVDSATNGLSVSARNANATFAYLQENLELSEDDVLQIKENGQITYSVGSRNWGDNVQGYELSNAEAVSVAKKQLAALGLLPQDEYSVAVSRIQRQKMNLSGEAQSIPETIEYTVSFYRTYNGIDVISNQEDGIFMSFNENGLTELRYLWREMEIVARSSVATSEMLTCEQAQAIYQTELSTANQLIVAENHTANMTNAYLQIGDEVRPVYVFSTDESYANCIFVDMTTGEILNAN